MTKSSLYLKGMRFLQLISLICLLLFPTANVRAQKLAFSPGGRIKANVYEDRMEMLLDGKTFAKGGLIEGLANGKWERFYSNGTVAVEGNYQKAIKDGEFLYFYPEGGPKANTTYSKGQRIGTWKSFWASGDLQTEIVYGENGTKRIRYYSKEDEMKSSLALEEEHIIGKDTLVYQRKYFGSNRPYLFEKRKNGVLDSLWIRFHESGAVWEKLLYIDGKLLSVILMHDANHNNLSRGNFVKGSGLLKRYRPNGSLFSEIQYKAGERHGRAWYYRNGKIAANGSYRNNLKVGTWKFFRESGVLNYEIDFYDAKEQWAYVTVFGSSGVEREENEYWRGLKHGLSRTFSFLNELEIEKYHSYGYVHGLYKEFLKGGTPKSQGAFAYGRKVGEWLYFNPNGRVTFKEQFVRNPSIDTSTVSFFNMNEVEYIGLRSSMAQSKLTNPKDRDLLRFDMLINEHPTYTFEPEIKYARFAGGNSSALQFIKYMQKGRANLNREVNGQVVLITRVDEFGFPLFSSIELGIGFGYDQAVLNNIKVPLIHEHAELHGLPSVGSYRHLISF